jgi:mRNA interferase MazF
VVSRGDVYWAELDPKGRPVVVLTRDPVADRIDNVTVALITTTVRHLATEVSLNRRDGMPKPCVVSLDNIRTIHRGLLGRRVTTLSQARMDQVCSALTYALGCA